MLHTRKAKLLGTAVPFMLETRDSGDSVAEIKRQIDGFMHAFEQFKKENDAAIADKAKKGATDVLRELKLDRINTELDKLEGLNQRLTAAENEAKKAKLEAEEAKKAKEQADEDRKRLDEIEKRMNRPGRGGSAEERRELVRKNANDWIRAVVAAHTMGIPNLSADQQKALAAAAAEYKALNVSVDTAGGYLAPMEYVYDIIKAVTEISPVRSLVRVRRTMMKSMQLPKRTGQFAAQWVAEQGTKTETTGLTYGREEVNTHEMYALIDISNQMLEDSAFDMEAELREESTEQFAVAEGAAVVTGNGVGKPEGWMTHADVLSTNSGSAATIKDADGQADGLLTLKHAIKTAYTRNASWALNRTTLGSVRKLKDADKNYIWMPGLAQGKPNTIDGDPYVEVPDMPNEAANAFPIAYGDFFRAYTLIDRIAMEMLRDPYTQATVGNVRFIFRRRVGGQVLLAEAIRKLKCAT